MGLFEQYRATGADLPYGDPLRAHAGVAMEGYFWRFTDVAAGRVVIALIGVNQGPDGPWSTLGLAGHPAQAMRVLAHPGGVADPAAVGASVGAASVVGASVGAASAGAASAGAAFTGDDRRVSVDLGPDLRLDVTLSHTRRWPNRRFGGSSFFHSIPALNQYWHPWLLGGRADGTVRLGDQEWRLDGAQVYAEKNWGREGFPQAWWWGQAQGFAEPQACVAFAGGVVVAGPPGLRLRREVTALVVALPDGDVVRLGNPVVSPVRTVTTDNSWRLQGRSREWQVDVEGWAPLDRAHLLPVPLPSQHRNVVGDIEHLAADLSITVRRRGRIHWHGETSLAALEHGGLDRAAAEVRRRGLPEATEFAPPVHDRTSRRTR